MNIHTKYICSNMHKDSCIQMPNMCYCMSKNYCTFIPSTVIHIPSGTTTISQ